ncbi:acyl-CoA/acyl-ACP dehydrogenase [Allokutzneria sp. A3M-2-11 16]|uniref:acyl-CoA dehydrogenase family protein n=1 Tax=Allokutzneria sp. A3M-2-11 16 TaxID=2962043 RepID=UPI0020B70187|nr:acyl-CoA dehydrogenase family protein [Allokutzneria sp. A3M-2-11 16]MCP3803319.1 acyl-CoA/acyl-ACP dehydrogenase [Allokutzneria sp. A3M-2-11 16]
MRFLREERARLDSALPGLDEQLADCGLMALEQQDNPGLALFRKAGGAGALVPEKHGGLGLSALAALSATRAIAARSPSLAVAATMHNFSVASLVALAERSEGFEWMLIDAIARDRLLVASAFAEGRTGQNILRPAMRAETEDGQWVVSGRKRPCSLSRSMDLLTASVNLAETGVELGIALIPATTPGISVRPFWNSLVLNGAESDEVTLDRVSVADELMVRPEPGLDELQTIGLVWFTLLISGCYLGAASALAERLLLRRRATAEVRSGICASLETAMFALERVASRVDDGACGADELAMALAARYTTQDLVTRTTSAAVEALGGMSFVESPEVAYLSATVHALAFHPPSRASLATAFDDYFDGAELRLEETL